ncbi:MAG: glycosyltransferase [Chloroflexi bacterium]|nr:glycosyltransferase [Chloroflexota bacterium]
MIESFETSRRFTIIIPARNAANTIAQCVAACARQNGVERSTYEIIVADDGSADETTVLAQQAGTDKIIRHERSQGAAAARNSGISAAQGEIIFFTDADCAPTPDWFAAMSAPFADPDLTGCKGIYATRQRQIVARFVQLEYEDKYDRLRPQPTIDFIDTYSAAYRRAALLDSGGFDARIFYVEDQELSFRLAAAGHKMIFQPTAVVYHLHSDSWPAYVRKKFYIGYWKAQIMRLHPDRIVKDSHTPQIIKAQMGLAALIILTLLGGALFTPLLLATAVLIALFWATAVPFIKKAWGKDWQVALIAPFLLFSRASALGFGYAWGMINRKIER